MRLKITIFNAAAFSFNIHTYFFFPQGCHLLDALRYAQ